ncbi:MAG: hypothetical protein ACX939_05260 [Hyphococcus sp.]
MTQERQRYATKAVILRAVKAAEDAGIAVAGFRVEPDGAIVIFDKSAAPLDEFEKWQESRQT